jgi:hypothetical protein
MPAIRWFLLGALLANVLGLGTELVLFEHFEEVLQMIPLALLGLALLLVIWNGTTRSAASVKVMRLLMVLFVVAGPVGIFLHYQANREFQKESDPSAPGWTIFIKAIHAKAPPPLAPGAMTQLGLLGLIYTYRHPSLDRSE